MNSSVCTVTESGERAWAEIDLGALVRNYRHLQVVASRSTSVMAVVKANAYGHGARQVVETLSGVCNARWFGVATLDEAWEVRSACGECRILVLSALLPEQAGSIVECAATPVLSDASLIVPLGRHAKALGIRMPVHVEVDTGMGRCGVLPADLPDLIARIAACPALQLEGIMTHFPDAEGDSDGTLRQIAALKQCGAVASALGHDVMLHAANSAGALAYPDGRLDMIRPGMALYGLMPEIVRSGDMPPLEPVLSLRARLLTVRDLPQSHPVSYGSTHVLRRPSRVAVLGIGYADGYRRQLSNLGHVLIRGRRAPILGRVCMDMTMVDVTDIPDVCAGDIATVIGRDGTEEVRAVDLARMIGATEHEITTGLSARVVRRYIHVC